MPFFTGSCYYGDLQYGVVREYKVSLNRLRMSHGRKIMSRGETKVTLPLWVEKKKRRIMKFWKSLCVESAT